MIQACKVPIVTYGLSDEADVYAKQLKLTAAGSNFLLCFKEFEIAVRTALVGEFNVYNRLAVAALGITLGLSLEQLAKLIGNFLPIEGRLEKVDNSLGLHIYVDYAHKPDALKKVLENFAILKTGRVITIFGCGGNRDKIKRPQMAAISEKFSDITIVTSDNPRQENPEDIINQVITGFSDSANYIVELDRYKAIEKAIQLARPDDIILIAGKGHETYQIFANKTIDFDDRLIAQQICRNTPLIPR
jgi:UDP-N-acetylmuramoyl-L-alanyl-D-glutamate--2,6-diaminopimelate ligase